MMFCTQGTVDVVSKYELMGGSTTKEKTLILQNVKVYGVNLITED